MVLQLLVPILISCLLEPVQIKSANQLAKILHTHAIHSLTRIGTQYPQVRFATPSTWPELGLVQSEPKLDCLSDFLPFVFFFQGVQAVDGQPSGTAE